MLEAFVKRRLPAEKSAVLLVEQEDTWCLRHCSTLAWENSYNPSLRYVQSYVQFIYIYVYMHYTPHTWSADNGQCSASLATQYYAFTPVHFFFLWWASSLQLPEPQLSLLYWSDFVYSIWLCDIYMKSCFLFHTTELIVLTLTSAPPSPN